MGAHILKSVSRTYLIYLIVLVAFFIFVYLLTKVQEVVAFESYQLKQIAELRTSNLTDFFIFVTGFGNEYLVFSVFLVITVFVLRRDFFHGLYIFFAVALGYFVTLLLKNIFSRPRPDITALFFVPQYSFPSGHAMNSTIFYGICIAIVSHLSVNRYLKYVLLILLFVLIVLIGTSRVYLGVHYPTDVLGGYVSGLAWLVSMRLIYISLDIVRKK